MNRDRILHAFETLPNIIESARNRAQKLPLDTETPRSVNLHKAVFDLHKGLVQMLPSLINKLVPGTFGKTLQRTPPYSMCSGVLTDLLAANYLKSPFVGWKIDNILENLKKCAENVRRCAEAIVEDMVMGRGKNKS